ncbi:uncharacterized protein LOC129779202 isoform X1 [Toxorhynchites rutilus septentrionalis]|uniref:uncharacterized protein LOC129779202 isoform X1 n=1 Tax=Toxorhynchites rutilus septentrionalis TaxID=329112 RepID=UPI0024790D28|nr:uncharacterized protein LOC129779202 isoform X1 [Toxorhynchites rutilus septentrionalis]
MASLKGFRKAATSVEECKLNLAFRLAARESLQLPTNRHRERCRNTDKKLEHGLPGLSWCSMHHARDINHHFNKIPRSKSDQHRPKQNGASKKMIYTPDLTG